MLHWLFCPSSSKAESSSGVIRVKSWLAKNSGRGLVTGGKVFLVTVVTDKSADAIMRGEIVGASAAARLEDARRFVLSWKRGRKLQLIKVRSIAVSLPATQLLRDHRTEFESLRIDTQRMGQPYDERQLTLSASEVYCQERRISKPDG